ncbi:MAG: outer membrane lipoprotein-sorting protein [Bdellovibrionota bacterium]
MKIILFFLPILALGKSTLSADDIMAKNEAARRVSSMDAKAKLVTKGENGEKSKDFEWWRELTGDQIHYNTLTRFKTPVEVRGEGILFREKSGGETDVQMYLPAFKKIRRVESQQQSGSFMGSEFSYSDIAAPKSSDYVYRLLRQEPCPNAAGVQCYVVESTPASEAIKDSTGTSKSVKWIRADNFMDTQGEYFNEKGELWKRMQATDIKKVDPKNNKWLAYRINMENVKNGRSTLLEFSDVKVNKGIAESTFSDQNLSREN